ncbi:MAG: hypothetical protein EOO43_26055, partial [Flavobacterium sp.]
MTSGLTIPSKPQSPQLSYPEGKSSTPNSARIILKPSTFDGKEATPRTTLRSKVTFNDFKLPTVTDTDDHDLNENNKHHITDKYDHGTLPSQERIPSQISLDHKTSSALSERSSSRRISNGFQSNDIKVPIGVKIIDTNNIPINYLENGKLRVASFIPKTTIGSEMVKIKNKLSVNIPSEMNPRSSKFRSTHDLFSGNFTERESMPSAITPRKSIYEESSKSRMLTSGSDFLYSALPTLSHWRPLPGEESVYEKQPPLIEKGEKMFKKKVSTLDCASVRKMKYDSLTYR